MTTRQIRDLAIRILGIYYLANAIIGVPQILAIFTLSGKEAGYVENKAVFAIASLTPVGMYFVVAYVLIFKAGVIMALLWPKADEETRSVSAGPSLTTWVSLIGLFYLIGSVGGAASELWILGTKREMVGSFVSYKFLPDLITMVLALLCIVKSRQIAEYLKRKTE